MKILFHHRTASKDGMDVHITELVAAFRRRGHDVVVVGPGGHDRAEFGSDGGLVSRLRQALPGAVSELLELLYSAFAYRRLRAAYLEHRPDVLYERYNLFLLAGRSLKKRYGLPFILEVNAPLVDERLAHGGLRLKRLARWCENAVWQAADRVLPVSGPLADYVRRADVPNSRLCVIPNGVDLQRFGERVAEPGLRKELGLDGAVVLGFTGFMRPWHGLDRVVELVARRRDLNIRLLIVGDGPIRQELLDQAAALGIGDRVIITGVIPRDQIDRYIACFDVALQPSAVAYASPLKLFEYMAMGRAIVAPDQANIREIVRHEDSALLFDPQDEEAFSTAVERLCRDKALRERLGHGARTAILKRPFTWDANAEKIEALIAEVRAGITEASGTGTGKPVQPLSG